MTGLCECGCGLPTKPARQTDRACGYIKGQPVRFRRGHCSRVMTAETRAKIGAVRKGKKRTEASRAAQRKAWAAKPAEVRAMSGAKGRAAVSLETMSATGRRVSAWLIASVDRRAIIEKQRAGHKRRWAQLDRETVLRRTEPGRRKGTLMARLAKPSSIEVAVAHVLVALGVEHQAQIPIGRYVVDFLIPEKQVVIECDGDYWHSKPGVAARDQRRDEWLMSQGYTVIRIPEHAIRAGQAAEFLSGVAI